MTTTKHWQSVGIGANSILIAVSFQWEDLLIIHLEDKGLVRVLISIGLTPLQIGITTKDLSLLTLGDGNGMLPFFTL